MTADRRYPEASAGPFPTPPRTITDDAARTITFQAVDWDRDREALVSFYTAFDPADRAQGVPPIDETAIRAWLHNIEAGYDVAARHDDEIVGHATLVPDDGDQYELAIFVASTYQNAGIGTALLETLLGLGQAEGVEYVWLSVERWNHAAVAVYECVGFETTDAGNFELEMGIRL
ncbi:MAG: GNAT family N-acetyltransferase [Halobacteriaceae archaeon]